MSVANSDDFTVDFWWGTKVPFTSARHHVGGKQTSPQNTCCRCQLDKLRLLIVAPSTCWPLGDLRSGSRDSTGHNGAGPYLTNVTLVVAMVAEQTWHEGFGASCKAVTDVSPGTAGQSLLKTAIPWLQVLRGLAELLHESAPCRRTFL